MALRESDLNRSIRDIHVSTMFMYYEGSYALFVASSSVCLALLKLIKWLDMTKLKGFIALYGPFKITLLELYNLGRQTSSNSVTKIMYCFFLHPCTYIDLMKSEHSQRVPNITLGLLFLKRSPVAMCVNSDFVTPSS